MRVVVAETEVCDADSYGVSEFHFRILLDTRQRHRNRFDDTSGRWGLFYHIGGCVSMGLGVYFTVKLICLSFLKDTPLRTTVVF